MTGLVHGYAMGTAACERCGRVNLADAEDCVEGYFHFRAGCHLGVSKEKRSSASRFQEDIQKDAIASAISRLHFEFRVSSRFGEL